MLLRSFDEMLTAYGIDELEKSDQADRSGMLMLCPYAVLFEGSYDEYYGIQNWYNQNIRVYSIPFCFMASWIMTMAFSSSFLTMLVLPGVLLN